MQRLRFTLILLLIMISVAFAKAPENFQEAKKIARVLWQDKPFTFYCGCSFNQYGIIDFSSCDYNPLDFRKDKRITWEHVVPVSWYGRRLSCWHQKPCQHDNKSIHHGRECCSKTDEHFKEMETDLHNLVPAIRSVNMARKNYVFGEFYSPNKSKYFYRNCHIIIDEKYQVVEPCDEVKGTIARIHLYMAKKYDIPLGDQQLRLMKDWNARFPAKEWEKVWNHKVAQVQGNVNEYIQ